MPVGRSLVARLRSAYGDDPRSENRPRHDRDEAALKILCIAVSLAIALSACAKQGPGIRVVQHADGVPPSVVITKL
jgi:hypothetical protein